MSVRRAVAIASRVRIDVRIDVSRSARRDARRDDGRSRGARTEVFGKRGDLKILNLSRTRGVRT